MNRINDDDIERDARPAFLQPEFRCIRNAASPGCFASAGGKEAMGQGNVRPRVEPYFVPVHRQPTVALQSELAALARAPVATLAVATCSYTWRLRHNDLTTSAKTTRAVKRPRTRGRTEII